MMDATEQVLRFLVAGSAATMVDFLGYNGYLRFAGKENRVTASLFSVSFAMVLSFFLNRFWVFQGLNASGWPVVPFLAVTLVSAFGIQSIVIHLLSKPSFLSTVIQNAPFALIQSHALWLERNLVKAAAVGAGLIWNFCWYRFYVFA